MKLAELNEFEKYRDPNTDVELKGDYYERDLQRILELVKPDLRDKSYDYNPFGKVGKM